MPPKGGIGQHHVVAVLLLNVGEVFGERVGVDYVRRLDAVQDHVHDGDDVGERLLFLADESRFLQRPHVSCLEVAILREVLKRLAQEAGRPDGAVVDALADLGLHDLHHRTDEWTRGVVLAAVPPGVAHVPDLGFIKMRQLVLFNL